MNNKGILNGIGGGPGDPDLVTASYLRKVGESVKNVVLLKAYKNVADIVDALDDADMLDISAAVSKCSRDDESITYDIRLLAEMAPDYWTLVIAQKDKLDN